MAGNDVFLYATEAGNDVRLRDPTTSGAGGATYSQALAVTLDDVTASVSQTAQHPQSLAATLDDVTAAVSQTATHPQSFSATLDGVTVAASQTASHPQSLIAALDGVTVAVAQGAQHQQTLAATIDSVTVAISQGATHPQALTATLDGIEFTAVQSVVGVIAESSVGGGRAMLGWDGAIYTDPEHTKRKAQGWERVYFDNSSARRVIEAAQDSSRDTLERKAKSADKQSAAQIEQVVPRTALLAAADKNAAQLLALETARVEIQQAQALIEAQAIEEADIAFVAAMLAGI